MLIQKLRLKRGWSQQQLAQASGLSARTIQRIEAGQPASVETLKSIASVFEVDFSTLNAEETNMDTTMTAADEAEREAFAHVRELRGFYVACMRYILIAMALFAINLLTSPHNMWSYWAMLGLDWPWRRAPSGSTRPGGCSVRNGKSPGGKAARTAAVTTAGPGHARSVPVPSGPQSIL